MTPVWIQLWRWAAVPEGSPVIGVCYDRAWHARAGISTKNYELCLTQAGAQILELDPDRHQVEQVLDDVDALLLTGGGDVDPDLYGGDPASAQLVDRPRDDFEIALIQEALRREMPILGICRGIQILNVTLGGTLRSIRDDPEFAARHGIDLSSFAAHGVTVEPDSRIAEVIGEGRHQVNSFHGQVVDRVADGLQVTAIAEDGLVEALERPDRTFVVATQWHPEIPPATMEFFERLVAEARRYRSRVVVDP
jgi:gamma-glutamyl-gamma-aminobutyrate hydrolase PuuD